MHFKIEIIFTYNEIHILTRQIIISKFDKCLITYWMLNTLSYSNVFCVLNPNEILVTF